MSKNKQVQTLLEYYREVAYKLGLKKDENLLESGSDKKEQKTDTQGVKYNLDSQENYSLFWFYDLLIKGLINLNPLASAFFEYEGRMPIVDKITKKYDSIYEMEHEFIEGAKLNESQKQAISNALGHENPISFIQGPPGTGKTHTILNIVSCILGLNMTVAVVSSNHAALDNIAAKVKEYDAIDKKSNVKPNQRRLANKYARLGNSSDRDRWSKEHPENKHRFCYGKHSFGQPNDSTEIKIGWESKIKAGGFLKDYPFITSTFHSLMKCFIDGDTYQYDYVIIDEASQCGILAGIIALNCAKNIVIVGDEEQLSPVHDNNLNPGLPDFPFADDSMSLFNICDKQGDGQSILAACREVFDKASKTFLDEHYRCHPGIIEFCNINVYNKRLKVKTCDYNSEVNTPIKVLWFEGDYCEGYRMKPKKASKQKTDGKEIKSTKCNMKQVTIFMEEEWPYLQKKFADESRYSVCILSPFRGQLESLKERIGSIDKKVPVELTDISGESLREKKIRINEEDVPDISDPAMLTIHKSQGQEFDLVYLLPVEDGDWEWPWSQGQKLINVAVSRAKRELRLIVSSCLMDEDTQRSLTGDEPITPGRMRELSEEEREQEEKRQRYIQKLVKYVRDRAEVEGLGYSGCNDGYDYGFHKTKLRSIFDDIPRYQRAKRKNETSKLKNDKDWAPEKCVEYALKDMNLEKMGIACIKRAPLSECFPKDDAALREVLSDEVIKYEDDRDAVNFTVDDKIEHIRKSNTHFDFVLFEKSTYKIVMAIEVDGAYHRFNKDRSVLAEQEKNDILKDSVAKDFGAVVYNGNKEKKHDDRNKEKGQGNPAFVLLRLPTDGSTYLEVEALYQQPDKEKYTGFQNSTVTIEHLLSEQLQISNEHHLRISESYIANNREACISSGTQSCHGIVKCLQIWGEKDKAFRTLSGSQANKLLRDEGFISGSSKEGWVPTGEGDAIGIVRAQNDPDDWKPRCLYTQKATEYLFSCLSNVLEAKQKSFF